MMYIYIILYIYILYCVFYTYETLTIYVIQNLYPMLIHFYPPGVGGGEFAGRREVAEDFGAARPGKKEKRSRLESRVISHRQPLKVSDN